jgi:hypothetical protein
MSRIVKYSAIFAAAAFLSLLALELLTFAWPSTALSGTPIDQALLRAGTFVGVAAFTATSIFTIIVSGTAGIAIAFRLALESRSLRSRLLIACGALYALTVFFLRWPAIRLVGDLVWLVCVVLIGAVFGYVAARSFASRAA